MTKKSTWDSRGKSMRERFLEKISRLENGCWIWSSAIGSRGYGIFWIGGGKRSGFAHRVSYELHKGQIPHGMVVMHSCDTPACVNPSHLSIGTHSDNQRDSSAKGRNAHGERNGGGGKLTGAQASQIKHATEGCLRLARKFGVSSQTVKAIRRGDIWKHVP